MKDLLIKELQQNVYLQRFYKAAKQGKVDNKKPDILIGEKNFFALALLASKNYHNAIKRNVPTMPDNELEELKYSLASILYNAPPFFIHDEVFLLIKDMKLPDHHIEHDIMPYDTIYLGFNGHIINPPFKVKSYILSKIDNDLTVVVFYENTTTNLPDIKIDVFENIFNKKFSELEEYQKGLIALLVYMKNKKVCECSKKKVPSSIIRKHPKEKLTTISIINLPREIRGYYKNKGTKRYSLEFRFLVMGHYRSQWYPSKKRHELIWIDAHTRGPKDKPIKEKIYNVK